LRRGIAFANPLLNFDHIICMLEQPGDARIVEQARAVCNGHSNGGGPLIIRNFKTEAATLAPLAGIKLASGPWQGKEQLVYGRILRPDAELSYRPIPDSPKYTATAVGHHEGFSGSLVLLDPSIPDDGKMSQLKRITPEYPFPEVEPGSHTYGTAWPLSTDFYLCNYNSGLYLLDRFGNRDVILDPGGVPYRVRDPFPLHPRPTPPVLPTLTWQGRRASLPGHKLASISVMNVYDARSPAHLAAFPYPSRQSADFLFPM